jgi:hypothetical protein
MAAYVDIIIFDKYDFSYKSWVPAEFEDHLNNMFCFYILRVGFSREDNLNRTRRVIDEAVQPGRIPEKKVHSLIFCESPGYADCQYIRIQSGLLSVTAFAVTGPGSFLTFHRTIYIFDQMSS